MDPTSTQCSDTSESCAARERVRRGAAIPAGPGPGSDRRGYRLQGNKRSFDSVSECQCTVSPLSDLTLLVLSWKVRWKIMYF